MKVGIGKHNDDKDINLSTRGLINVLSVEITDEDGDQVSSFGGAITKSYDYIGVSYVAAGNGVGEVETLVFKTGGAGGTTVGTVTLTYDGSGRVSTWSKT